MPQKKIYCMNIISATPAEWSQYGESVSNALLVRMLTFVSCASMQGFVRSTQVKNEFCAQGTYSIVMNSLFLQMDWQLTAIKNVSVAT